MFKYLAIVSREELSLSVWDTKRLMAEGDGQVCVLEWLGGDTVIAQDSQLFTTTRL